MLGLAWAPDERYSKNVAWFGRSMSIAAAIMWEGWVILGLRQRRSPHSDAPAYFLDAIWPG
jgi:hypothetical protein